MALCTAECDKITLAWNVASTSAPTGATYCTGVLWDNSANTCKLYSGAIIASTKTGNGDANQQCASRDKTQKGKDYVDKKAISDGTTYSDYTTALSNWKAQLALEDVTWEALQLATAYATQR